METKPTLADALALAEQAPEEKDPDYEVNRIDAIQYDGSDESMDDILDMLPDFVQGKIIGDTLVIVDEENDFEMEIELGEWFVFSYRNGIIVVSDINLGRTL